MKGKDDDYTMQDPGSLYPYSARSFARDDAPRGLLVVPRCHAKRTLVDASRKPGVYALIFGRTVRVFPFLDCGFPSCYCKGDSQ